MVNRCETFWGDTSIEIDLEKRPKVFVVYLILKWIGILSYCGYGFYESPPVGLWVNGAVFTGCRMGVGCVQLLLGSFLVLQMARGRGWTRWTSIVLDVWPLVVSVYASVVMVAELEVGGDSWTHMCVPVALSGSWLAFEIFVLSRWSVRLWFECRREGGHAMRDVFQCAALWGGLLMVNILSGDLSCDRIYRATEMIVGSAKLSSDSEIPPIRRTIRHFANWRFELQANHLQNVHAMVELGLYHLAQKDYDSALQWYRRAAENGSGFACSMLGVFYQKGWGVPASTVEAANWYRKAVDMGYESAREQLNENIGDGKCE